MVLLPAPFPNHQLAEPFHNVRPEKGAGSLVSVGQVAQNGLTRTWMSEYAFIDTYLSFRKAKPRIQGSTQFYTRGLKLCCECSFRGERERTCEVELSIGTMVQLHNIPPLRRETHRVFTEEIQLVQSNSRTVNSKLTTMIRTIYSYKTYNHVVFVGFLPGFISVHGCFYFMDKTKTFFPKLHLLIHFHDG